MFARVVLTLAVVALGAAPAQAQEPAVSVMSPTWSTTISDAQVDHWARISKAKTHDAKRHDALNVLIEAAWLEGEGRERGITVTRAQAKRLVEDRRTGETMDDAIARARSEALETAIKDQIAEPAAKSVTPEQIEAYVQQHPRTTPETRRARTIEARNRTEAKRALKQLRQGLTWRTATQRYPGGTETFTPTADSLHRAIFKAPLNELTRYGTHVFEVVEITPPQPVPIEEQRATAWEILATEAQKQAQDAHAQAFEAKWRARTTCAPHLNVHPRCGNPPTDE